jgi:hypothetical protein
MYGNGGLKMWTRQFVNNMRTHENSDPNDHKGLVEFCFDDKYYQFNESYSESFTNATPFQAWRAGFREGVKMSLDQGTRVSDIRRVYYQNYERLLIWCNIGADVPNGVWSMLGAREGCYLTNCTDWDHANVRDFEYLKHYWEEQGYRSATDIEYRNNWLGNEIKNKCGLEIANLDADDSKFFRRVYRNLPRMPHRV